MKIARFAWLLAASLTLIGCGGTYVRETMAEDGKTLKSVEYGGGSPDYALYAHTVARQSAPPPAIDVTACAGDSTCIVAVAALADRGRGAGQPVIQPPPPKVSGWDKAGRFFLGALGIAAPAAVNWHQADTSAESTQALYGMIGQMHAGTVAMGSVPTTVTNIGGDQIGRDRTETNTTVGGNLGDTQAIGGNLGDTQTIGRDLIGGDRIDNTGVLGNGNDTRFGSPGPYDDHSDPGNDCTGSDCSVQLPEDPDPGT